MNQRAVRIHNIRQNRKALKSQYKVAGQEERTGLAQLMCILQKTIRVLHRAEWHRRRRERARKRAAFITNPFKFTKDLLGQMCSSKPASSQKDIDQHLKQLYSDPAREQDNLIEPPEPAVQFDMSELQLTEVRHSGGCPQSKGKLCSRTERHFIQSVRTVPNSCPKLLQTSVQNHASLLEKDP